MTLEKAMEHIYHCFRCGYCREMTRGLTQTYGVCPVYEEMRFEQYCARGRIAIARAILEGKLDYSDGLVDLVYTDLGCGLCKEVCPLLDWAKVDFPRISRAWREEIVRKGMGPPKQLKEVDFNLKKEYNPFGKENRDRFKWSSNIELPKTADMVYFTGCYASYKYPEIAVAMTNILQKARIEFTVAEERCCGIPAIWDGQTEIAEELAIHNIEALQKAEARKVVTTCPGCYLALKFDYQEIVGKTNFEVLHASELFSELIDKQLLSIKKLEKKVTFHDPCHLGRHAKIYEPPRKVIKSIPGIELIEMQRNKQNAWCCGSGVVVRTAFPDLSLRIAGRRIEEAKQTGAQALVTACPSCLDQLSLGAKRMRTDLELYDLTVFLAKAID